MKALIFGVAISAAAGMTAGDAMRPELAVAPPPMEPVASGAGATSYTDAAGVWGGRYPVPDYVVGTDWLPRAPDPIDLPDVTSPEMEPPEAAPPPAVDASWRDAPSPARPAYPSERGDILAGVGRTPSPVDEAVEPPAA